MPLPPDGASWPPAQWTPSYATMRLNDAWYSGDKSRLAAAAGIHQPQQTRRRWSLWRRKDHAAPAPVGLHIPLPADIARTSATMLFADMPTITVDNGPTNDRLAELIVEARIKQTLLAAGEQCAAMNGIYLRVTWDKEVLPDRPILSVMQPDRADPEFRHGILTAVTFWRDLTVDGASTVWRHLERYEPGRIVHSLYKGTGTNLGKRQPSLGSHPQTADLAKSLGPDGESIATGYPGLAAAYIPNMLPNRLDRASPVGRSDFDQCYDFFNPLDATWTSWMRDLKLARSRIIVPKGYLRDRGPGLGAEFDDDAEVYEALNIPPTEAGAGITLNQFEIRVAQHMSTAEFNVRQAVQTAGYDAQAFGMDGGGQPITATEVNARTSRSMGTRDAKIGYWTPELASILEAFLAIDRAQFNRPNVVERPTVEFPEGVSETALQIATTIEMLSRAGAISTETKVRLAHPDWDEQDVKAEVAKILAELGMAVADPTRVGADNVPPPAGDEPEPEDDEAEQVPEFAGG
ncbi:phage portal protein [Yinghuangia soli]|uniref:Phage portal protein n=1 Tax=Yinghuangia soli TaxID=2908204 RepID=A0AA41Q5R6_9ACTN|nr:phage portal protein [Yinghuangia soli]MCF2531742.1 phage portal protein [Yinghuangia soli]